MPVWAAEPHRRRASTADETLSPLHVVVPAPLDADFLVALRLPRRHHPDPAADPAERRVDRRHLPVGRPRVLPVRDGRPRARERPCGAPLAPTDDASRPGRLEPDVARRWPSDRVPPRRRWPLAASAVRHSRDPVRDGRHAGPRRSGRPGTARRPRRLVRRPRRRPAISPSRSTSETPAERARRGALVADLLERARRHPYVRLALNGSFSALWVGQLISLFGDRHAPDRAGVPRARRDELAARRRPGLPRRDRCRTSLLGPVAGTFVDRWDQKEVMVVSDLLRAALVLLVPIAAVTNLVLIYPLVFLMTSISIFFRPARTAILPRIVAEDELLTANSRDVDRRDARRRHRLSARRAVRGIPGPGPAARLLVRRGDLRRVGAPDRDDGGAGRLDSATFALSGRVAAPAEPREHAADDEPQPPGNATRAAAASPGSSTSCSVGWQLPSPRDRAAREHPAGRGRPVHGSASS